MRNIPAGIGCVAYQRLHSSCEAGRRRRCCGAIDAAAGTANLDGDVPNTPQSAASLVYGGGERSSRGETRNLRSRTADRTTAASCNRGRSHSVDDDDEGGGGDGCVVVVVVDGERGEGVTRTGVHGSSTESDVVVVSVLLLLLRLFPSGICHRCCTLCSSFCRHTRRGLSPMPSS